MSDKHPARVAQPRGYKGLQYPVDTKCCRRLSCYNVSHVLNVLLFPLSWIFRTKDVLPAEQLEEETQEGVYRERQLALFSFQSTYQERLHFRTRAKRKPGGG